MLINCTYESTLKKDIVDTSKCCRCGTCAAVCPKNVSSKKINPIMQDVISNKQGPECSLCYDTCPMNHQPVMKGLGKIISAFASIASDEYLRKQGQDGGACTAFLESLTGYEVCSIKSSKGIPVPTINDTIRDNMKSTYSATSSLSLFPRPHANIAFVGLPCQIYGIHRAHKKGLLQEISLTIGLFCTKNYDHKKFWQIASNYDIYPENVSKIEIRKIVSFFNEDILVKTVPTASFDDASIPGCHNCTDFTGLYSDISFGSEGTEKGYTTVIIRTPLGRELFENAVKNNYISIKKTVDIEKIASRQETKRERNLDGQTNIHRCG